MANRRVEVFTAGCPLCDEAVKLVRDLACDSCQVRVYNLHDGRSDPDGEGFNKTLEYGINRLPAVVVDGQLVDCCRSQRPITRDALRTAGIGAG